MNQKVGKVLAITDKDYTFNKNQGYHDNARIEMHAGLFLTLQGLDLPLPLQNEMIQKCLKQSLNLVSYYGQSLTFLECFQEIVEIEKLSHYIPERFTMS